MMRTAAWLLTSTLLLAASCGQPGGGQGPEQPVEPEEPETPAEPAEPEQPETPAEPETPEEPEPPAAQDKGPETITLGEKAKPGKVVFGHDMHQVFNDCTTCHHTAVEGSTPQACHACHGQVEEAPIAKLAFHATCQGCHKKDGDGPVKCIGCHKK